MEFEWDEAKSERNRIERGLPFRVAAELFDGPVLDGKDDRFDYGERRSVAIGRVGDLIVVCIYTDRDGIRRIISIRRANRKERDGYRTGELRQH